MKPKKTKKTQDQIDLEELIRINEGKIELVDDRMLRFVTGAMPRTMSWYSGMPQLIDKINKEIDKLDKLGYHYKKLMK